MKFLRRKIMDCFFRWGRGMYFKERSQSEWEQYLSFCQKGYRASRLLLWDDKIEGKMILVVESVLHEYIKIKIDKKVYSELKKAGLECVSIPKKKRGKNAKKK